MKKTFYKQTADALEKLAVGAMLVGLFQNKQTGIWIGMACMAVSYFFSFMEVRA